MYVKYVQKLIIPCHKENITGPEQEKTKKPIVKQRALEKFLIFITTIHDVKIKSWIKDKLVRRPGQELGKKKNSFIFLLYIVINIRWIQTTKKS